MDQLKNVGDTHFFYDEIIESQLLDLQNRIQDMWGNGRLSPQILKQEYQNVKIDEIYHSNRIEGNSLTLGETREVIEKDGELSHIQRPLRDKTEARNLARALDFAYETAQEIDRPVSQNEIRQIHALILKGIQNDAGKYRTTQNRIVGSRYATPEAFQVPQQMSELSDYIFKVTPVDNPSNESPILCAAAAHAWLAQIHPFSDGNGRASRALVNLILVRNRYIPCIITEDDRSRYINALEESQGGDLTPLAELIFENVDASLSDTTWLSSLVTRVELPAINRVRDEYEIWQNALDHLKSQFRHTVDNMNATLTLSGNKLKFADYEHLTIEKYLSLRNGERAKKTWYFGIEFNIDGRRERYVFFFGYADRRIRQRAAVVLCIAKNTRYGYVRLEDITQSNNPDVHQIGFDLDPDSRKFITQGIGGVRQRNLDSIVKQFFTQVIERDFGS